MWGLRPSTPYARLVFFCTSRPYGAALRASAQNNAARVSTATQGEGLLALGECPILWGVIRT